MLSVRKVEKRPQVISTNGHLMQGYYYELSDVNLGNNNLSGKAKFVRREPMKIVIVLNGHMPVAAPTLTVCADGKLAVLALDCRENETAD